MNPSMVQSGHVSIVVVRFCLVVKIYVPPDVYVTLRSPPALPCNRCKELLS
jgi:hypothetical protein